MVVLDGSEPADPRANVDAYLGRLFRRYFKSCVIHGQLSGAHGVVDEGIHLLNVFLLDELGRIEIFDLTGNLGIIPGRIELRDPTDPRLTGTDRLPCLVDACPERGHETQASDDTASLCTITHRCVQKLGFFFDVIESFAHRENLFSVLVWNLDAEFFFERHDKLNSIQRVRPEVFDETRLGRHFIFLNSELLRDNFLHPFVYCSHKRAVLLPDRVGSSAVLSSAASPYQDMSIPPLTCST